MAQISKREYQPYTFHMCWYVRRTDPGIDPSPTRTDHSNMNRTIQTPTPHHRTQTKHDKLVNLQNASLWFVAEACNSSAAAVTSLRDQKVSIDACCVDPLAGPAASR